MGSFDPTVGKGVHDLETLHGPECQRRLKDHDSDEKGYSAVYRECQDEDFADGPADIQHRNSPYEYREPLDRRFHAQPDACWVCGPRMTLTENGGKTIDVDDPIAAAAEQLAAAARMIGISTDRDALVALADGSISRSDARDWLYANPGKN